MKKYFILLFSLFLLTYNSIAYAGGLKEELIKLGLQIGGRIVEDYVSYEIESYVKKINSPSKKNLSNEYHKLENTNYFKPENIVSLVAYWQSLKVRNNPLVITTDYDLVLTGRALDDAREDIDSIKSKRNAFWKLNPKGINIVSLNFIDSVSAKAVFYVSEEGMYFENGIKKNHYNKSYKVEYITDIEQLFF